MWGDLPKLQVSLFAKNLICSPSYKAPSSFWEKN